MTLPMDLPIGMMLGTERQVLLKVVDPLEVPLELSSSASVAVSSVSFVAPPLHKTTTMLMMATNKCRVTLSLLPPQYLRLHNQEELHKSTVMPVTSCNSCTRILIQVIQRSFATSAICQLHQRRGFIIAMHVTSTPVDHAVTQE
jgi:hypothetical protein